MAVVIFPAAGSFSPKRLPVPPENCETANQTDRRFEIFAVGDRSLTQPLIRSCSPRLYDDITPNLLHPADQTWGLPCVRQASYWPSCILSPASLVCLLRYSCMRACTHVCHDTYMEFPGLLSGLLPLLPWDLGLGLRLSGLCTWCFDLLTHLTGPRGKHLTVLNPSTEAQRPHGILPTANITGGHSRCEQEPGTHRTMPVHTAL